MPDIPQIGKLKSVSSFLRILSACRILPSEDYADQKILHLIQHRLFQSKDEVWKFPAKFNPLMPGGNKKVTHT